MDDTAALLRDREARGLTWFLAAQIAVTAAWGIGGLFFITASGRFFVFGTSVVAVAVQLGLLHRVKRRRALAGAGIAALLIAFAMMAPSPFLEWRAAGIDAVPAAYVFKTGLLPATVVMALSALTLHPRYPLIFTALVTAWQVFLLVFALDDPGTVLSERVTWEEHVTGAAIHPGRAAFALTMSIGSGLALGLVTWVARRTVRSAVALEKANGQLRRYFAPEIAERIATADRDFLKPGGRLREVVVLVSDIAGFTPISRALGPDATLRLLAAYQARMTAAIFAAGGSVDKFVGDGILATFGATGTLDHPERRAVAAALAMGRALAALNAERTAAGGAPLRHRIGLHAGEALVGNVGSAERLEFTVIGDVVNVAARIEGACKTTGDSILASDAVVRKLADHAGLTPRGAVPLAGVEAPPALFAVAAAPAAA